MRAMKTQIDTPPTPLPIRAAWPAAFPDADIHATESRVKKHPRYAAAKAGDIQASVDLVDDLMDAAAVETLKTLRDKHGDIEPWWRAEFGYGFDVLTESEARYLSRAEDADTIRARLVAAARQGDG